MQRELNYVVDIGQRIIEQPLNEPLFTHEQNAHAINVTLKRYGEDVQLSGAAECEAYILHEETQVSDRVEGSIEGNVVTVVIPPDTYLTPGFVRITLLVTEGEETLAVLRLTGTIKITRSSNIYDPSGQAIPDTDELIRRLQDIEEYVDDVEAFVDDVTAVLAPSFDPEDANGYSVGEFVIHNAKMYRCVAPHTGAWDPSHFEETTAADMLEAFDDEISDLKSQVNRAAKAYDEVEEESDLDIADEDGNVILRLNDGHIKTKNFDSETLDSEYSIIRDTEAADSDLDITDRYGNSISRFVSGGIHTKRFKGFEYIEFKSPQATYNGSACVLTVSHKFHAGDRITLHVEHGLAPWKYGGAVTYKAGDTVLFSGRGDNAFVECVLFEDADEITANYGASAAGMVSGDVMTFEVYLMGDIPVHPTVVKIKADGSGDYQNFRAALEAIGTKADDVIHPYRFEVYPGTYDILADYTQEEIEAAEYSDTGFVGLKLINGMSMVGIGDRDKIVITASMDTEIYDATTRNKVSTLNLQGSVTVENITFIAHNLRYTVHDDFNASVAKPIKRIIRDCVFEGYGAMTYPRPLTWGAGTPQTGADVLFENCRFNGEIAIHTYHGEMYHHCPVRMVNCSATNISIGDIEVNADESAVTEFHLENCNIPLVRTYNWHLSPSEYTVSHVAVYGHGGHIEVYDTMPFCYYESDDTEAGRQDGTNLSVGDVVMRESLLTGIGWDNATSADVARGVVITAIDDQYVVQVSGMVLCERVGVTQFQLGDYIGVSNGKLAVVQSAADAVGRVVYVTSGRGFIELDWRK